MKHNCVRQIATLFKTVLALQSVKRVFYFYISNTVLLKPLKSRTDQYLHFPSRTHKLKPVELGLLQTPSQEVSYFP